MDPALRLLASRSFLATSTVLSLFGTLVLLYIMIAGVDISQTTTLRLGVALLISFMSTGMSLEARRAIA